MPGGRAAVCSQWSWNDTAFNSTGGDSLWLLRLVKCAKGTDSVHGAKGLAESSQIPLQVGKLARAAMETLNVQVVTGKV